MSRHVEYDDLPNEIRQKYTAKDIFKAVKPTHTIIMVYVKATKEKETWRKQGSTWFVLNAPGVEKEAG